MLRIADRQFATTAAGSIVVVVVVFVPLSVVVNRSRITTMPATAPRMRTTRPMPRRLGALGALVRLPSSAVVELGGGGKGGGGASTASTSGCTSTVGIEVITGQPQCGHADACVDTWRWQSLHSISAIASAHVTDLRVSDAIRPTTDPFAVGTESRRLGSPSRPRSRSCRTSRLSLLRPRDPLE